MSINQSSRLALRLFQALCLLSCFAGGAVLAGQDPEPEKQVPRSLSLEDAEKLLLQRNLALAVSRYQVEAGRAARFVAGFKPNPQLTLGTEQVPVHSPLPGSFPRFFDTNPDAGANPVYTFRVDKIIERGKKRELRVEQADFQVKVAEAQLLDSIRNQLFQLRQAFTTAMLARDNLKLAETVQAQYARTEELTKTRVDSGELAPVELYRVRAGRLQYQQAALQQRMTYEQATRDILNLMAVTPEERRGLTAAAGQGNPTSATSGTLLPGAIQGAPLEVTGEFYREPVSQELGALQRLALTERPDVLAARNGLELAGRSSLLARAQRARDLDVATEYQRVGQDDTLGIVLQIPLFVYNNQRAAIQQAEAQRRAAETQLRQLELQALTDVEKAFLAHQSSRRMLDLYNSENLAEVGRLRDIAAASFKEGAVSLFELLDSQRTYNQSITAYNQARADYQMSLWQLEQAVGRPLRP